MRLRLASCEFPATVLITLGCFFRTVDGYVFANFSAFAKQHADVHTISDFICPCEIKIIRLEAIVFNKPLHKILFLYRYLNACIIISSLLPETQIMGRLQGRLQIYTYRLTRIVLQVSVQRIVYILLMYRTDGYSHLLFCEHSVNNRHQFILCSFFMI